MTSAARVIATRLTDLGLADYRPSGPGGSCFLQHLPAEPAEAVGVTDLGGRVADMGGTDALGVQIRVRAEEGSPAAGWERAQAIYEALRQAGTVTTAVGTLGSVGAQPPTSMGADSAGRTEWVIRVQCTGRVA